MTEWPVDSTKSRKSSSVLKFISIGWVGNLMCDVLVTVAFMCCILSLKTAVVKARSLWRSIRSLRHGQATARTYSLRRAECLDCDRRIETPRANYCGACGCPKWLLSRLEVKWRLRGAQCPQDKW